MLRVAVGLIAGGISLILAIAINPWVDYFGWHVLVALLGSWVAMQFVRPGKKHS